MQVRLLGGEDARKEGTGTHSRILAWEIAWTEEPSRLRSIGHKELDVTEVT